MWFLAIVFPMVIPSTASTTLKILAVVVPLCLFFSVFALPWEIWLPGTAVVSGSASWIDRHANMLTFLGFLLALVVLIASLVRGFIRGTAQDKTP